MPSPLQHHQREGLRLSAMRRLTLYLLDLSWIEVNARAAQRIHSQRTHLLYDTHVEEPLIAGAVDGGQFVQRDLLKTEWGRSRMLRSLVRETRSG